jgi:ubiquitin-conjugating enzyme (huntingtin interacting protein 2)
VLTIKSALIMLQSLLSSPEPKDPQDAEVATMLLKSPEDYNHRAREWAVEYAGAPRRELTSSSKDKTEESAKKVQQQLRQKEKEKDKDKTSQYVFCSLICSSSLTWK